MKRLNKRGVAGWLMILILVTSFPVMTRIARGATILHEQTIAGGSSSSTTLSTSSSLTGVANHLYLAAIMTKSGSPTVKSVTGLGLTWSLLKAQCAGRNQTRVEVWKAMGLPTGNGVVTATLNSAPLNAVILVSRYSGANITTPIGNIISANTKGVGGVCSGGVDNTSYSVNLTTALSNAMVYGAIAMRNRNHTPGSGYTERGEVMQGSSGDVAGGAVMDRTMVSPSTVTVNGTFSSTVDWAVVAIEIRPSDGTVNHPPVAQDQSVTTSKDTPKAVHLVATDADGDPLTYSVVTQPAHGVLSGPPPDVNYAPNTGYIGADSFTFKANDGKADSNAATVSVTVTSGTTDLDAQVAHALDFAASQLDDTASSISNTKYPHTTTDGSWNLESASSWTSGFFPGALWWMYEWTGDSLWRTRAEDWTKGLEGQKNDTGTHDVGFIIYNSFGRGYGLTANESYRQVVLTAAGSLATRYSPIVGCTRSWNGSNFIVIIDNMMNLELLFWGARNGGNPQWYDMAVSHALKTRQNHVRSDGSTYHVVEYNESTGAVVRKRTAQGCADNSTWSRGQAWAVYGFTMSYRETGDTRFLETAQNTADYFLSHLPADHVPLWDFDVPTSDCPQEYKDSSAAAIAAAGLLELSQYAPLAADRDRYWQGAKDILLSLTSSAYLAEGTSSPAVLLHGARNVPSNGDMDNGLIWGDYYFIEAMRRYHALAATLPNVSFASAGSSMTEANATAELMVNLSTKSPFPVTVDYAATGGNATAGADYAPLGGTLIFDSGQTAKPIDVQVINDSVVEGNETIELTLSYPVGAILGTVSLHVFTILDNDTATPPVPPTGLTATAGNAQVALTWSASAGAVSYNVKRSTTSGSGYSTIKSGVTATNYTDTTVTNGTTYYYVVTAVNAAGESGNSNEASATPTQSLPPPPTGLSATPGNGQVGLTWNASTGATSYNVKRSSTSGGPYSTIASGVTATSYTDTGLTNGTTYYYVVTAVNGAGESEPSNQASATPSSGGAANIVFQEIKTGGSSSSTTVATSAPVTGVANHLYLAAIMTKSGSPTVKSVTGLGLTWSLLKAQCAGRNQTRVEVWKAMGLPTGNGVVTATLNSAPLNAVILVSRYSGVSTTAPIGNIVSANTMGVGGVCSGGVDNTSYSVNLPTEVSNAMVYGAVAMRNRSHTPGSGYTERAEVMQGSSGDVAGGAVMDRTVSTPAVVTVNGTFSSTVDWAVVALEMRP